MAQHGEQNDHEYELVEMCSQTNPSTSGGTNKIPSLPPPRQPRPTKPPTVASPTGGDVSVAREGEEESADYIHVSQ